MKDHYPIPRSVFLKHAAFLGMTGSGKTYAAKGAAERILQDGERICVIDPTSAWWGLKSSKSGKRAGFEITIFGGEHADLQISKNHGAAVAEIVRTTDISCIIDTLQMSVSDRTKFFTDFAEALLQKKGPLNLFIDEAHNFAPQGKVPDPQAGKMLHATNNLLAMGRSRGLRVTMLSQRPQKLHKDSLSEVQSLVVMQLTSPQNRHAIEEWIEENADKEKGRELIRSLSALKRGNGWVWSPQNDIFEKVKFPEIETYDSSADPDQNIDDIVLAKADLGEIGGRLEQIVDEIKKDDPALLRARIKDLENKKPAPAVIQIDEKMIKKSYEEGFRAGRTSRDAIVNAAQMAQKSLAEAISSQLDEKISPISSELLNLLPPKIKGSNPKMIIEPKKPKSDIDLEGISRPQKKILDSIALLNSLGVESPKRTHVAAFCACSPKSSGFEKNLSTLKTKEYIRYPSGGEVALTPEGGEIAEYPDRPATSEDLHSAWYAQLSNPQEAILSILIDIYPEAASRENIAAQVGVSFLSSGYEKNLSTLRSLGLIDYPDRGMVVASETLFP